MPPSAVDHSTRDAVPAPETSVAPFALRLWSYLLERFPPGPYALLVAVFYGASAAHAVSLGGGEAHWRAAIVIFLAFFQLRIFDEHKDYAKDVVAHPDRVLSRGLITLQQLTVLGALGFLVQATLAWSLGDTAFTWWMVATLFMLLMRVEFGLGAFLGDRMFLYAVTHNPVSALLTGFAWASTGASFSPDYLPFVAMVTFGMFALEFGRKTRRRHEERPGVETYSARYGRRTAGWLVAGSSALTGAFAAWALGSLDAGALPWALAGIATFAGVIPALTGGRSKLVEIGSTLTLLLSLLAIGTASW